MIRTLACLELEATMLGITVITFIRKEQTWKATAFGDGPCVMGEGKNISTAYDAMISQWRGTTQARL